MGAPAKKDGKACEGFKIFTGGKIGENPELAKEFAQVSVSIPNIELCILCEKRAQSVTHRNITCARSSMHSVLNLHISILSGNSSRRGHPDPQATRNPHFRVWCKAQGCLAISKLYNKYFHSTVISLRFHSIYLDIPK